MRFGRKNRPQKCPKCDCGDAGALRAGFSLILGLVIWLLPILPQLAYTIWENKRLRPRFWKVFWNAEPQLLFVDKSLSKQILLSLLISLLLISLSFILGSFEAVRFKPVVRYILEAENRQYVFLRRYGNSILLRQINPEGNELSQSVVVMTLDDLSGTPIATERMVIKSDLVHD